MDRFDNTDNHLVFEGISDGIDNKFGLESIFYGLGFLAYLIVIALFIDLFYTSITSPILYSTFAPIRRRRRRRRRDLTAHNLTLDVIGNGNVNEMEMSELLFPRILILIDEIAEFIENLPPPPEPNLVENDNQTN